jgi:hypothetical protein
MDGTKMRDVRCIDRTKLNEILRAYYGCSSISVRRIWCSGGTKNLGVVDLGPDGILDMLLDVDDREEDKNERTETCWSYKVAFLVPNRHIHMSSRAILIREKEGCVTWLEPCEE